MLPRSLVLVGLLALLVPAVAVGKGPSSASLTGPGIAGSLPLNGDGEGSSGPLGTLVSEGGFFPAVYGQEPNPLLKTRPKGELGLRYLVKYVLPGPHTKSILRQTVYPYAAPRPVTYLRRGQEFWNGRRTYGGWFVASPRLKAALVAAGLPAAPPTDDGGFWTAGVIAGLAGGVTVALSLAALGSTLRRRRLRPAAV